VLHWIGPGCPSLAAGLRAAFGVAGSAVARRLSQRFLGAAKKTSVVDRYWADPVRFAEVCIEWPTGEGLTEYQVDIDRHLVTERRVCARGPRGYGKSAGFAIVIIWFALTRELARVAWKIVTTGQWSSA